MLARTFSYIAAQAIVPEQLTSYVTAVGQSRPVLCAECIAYTFEDTATLIAYTPNSFPHRYHEEETAALNDAVAAAMALPGLKRMTVLGPAKPKAAPPDTISHSDSYAFIPLPMIEPKQNLRNMLRRGARECSIMDEVWHDEHAALVETYLASRPLEAGTRHIYRNIAAYLTATPDAVLFSARDSAAKLLAFAIGDYTSLTTACYMFAFRRKNCPPGVADCLLHAIVKGAQERGHAFLNLGLGINSGITAFKKKWGEAMLLPCIETRWALDANAHFGLTRNPEPAYTSALEDPLAVFRPLSFTENLKEFFRSTARPFDCLQIEVTSQCPGRCTYCPHTTKKDIWLARRMEDTTFSALLPVIKKATRVHLQGWGEPLLHPRFFDFATAARRVGCAVSTTTYGLTLNEDMAEKLILSGIDIAAFSLTGVDEASNATREGVPFAKVRAAILALNRAKQRHRSEYPHTHLAYLMLASRAASVARLPALMAELDIPVAVVSTLDYIALPGMENEAYAPHEKEKVETASLLLRQAALEAANAGRALYYSLPGEHGRNECNERVQSCMYIDAEGQISPCIYVNLPTRDDDPCRRVYGCALQKNPLDIWNKPEYVLFRQRLADGNPDLPCLTCAKRFERIV